MERALQVAEQHQQPVTIDYVPSVAVTLEQMADNLRKLDAIRTKIMRKGVDYDTIPGTPKPTLLKPGAERLLQFFGLGHRVECAHKIEDWDNGFFYYVYRATIIKQYPTHTIVVAECEGSANSKEKRYRNQDVFSIVNTLQKMAIKRALVGATLQATGTSGFFTQDLDDMDIDLQPTENEQPQQRSNGRNRSAGNGQVSQAQINYMHKIRNDKGLTEEEFRALLKGMYNVESSKDLEKKAASELINFLQDKSAEELKQIATEYMGAGASVEQQVIDISDDDIPF